MAQYGNLGYLLFLLVASYQVMENDAGSTTATVPDTTDSSIFSSATVITSSQPNNDSFYCNVTYECSDPFTFGSTNSLKDGHCACREGWLTTSTCCLSQWWFIGLACGAGAILLLAFLIATCCCCSYKSDAKKAKAVAAHSATHSNHKTHDDIELHDDIKSPPHHVPATAAMATFAANEHGADHKDLDAHSIHSVEAHHVTPTHATPASHSNEHIAPAEAHPVAATAAVAAVVHEATDNQTHNQHPTPAHHNPSHEPNAHHVADPKQHPGQPQVHNASPPHQYHYNNGGPSYNDPKQYNRYTQPPYQGHSDPYYPPNRQQPYGGYSNPRYSEDNDSLETYDDTALPTTNYNNYNNYNYGGQNVSSNKKNHTEPNNSSLLKIDSSSQFIINRPSVIF